MAASRVRPLRNGRGEESQQRALRTSATALGGDNEDESPRPRREEESWTHASSTTAEAGLSNTQLAPEALQRAHGAIPPSQVFLRRRQVTHCADEREGGARWGSARCRKSVCCAQAPRTGTSSRRLTVRTAPQAPSRRRVRARAPAGQWTARLGGTHGTRAALDLFAHDDGRRAALAVVAVVVHGARELGGREGAGVRGAERREGGPAPSSPKRARSTFQLALKVLL